MRSRSDEVARQRQELPWVPINKGYRFETDEGSASLADLFRGRSQLLVYHFMFGPDYAAGCPSCSMIADGFEGFAVHLANHDVMLWAVSRAPLPKLQGYKRRMGWTFPWASSFGGDFNFDFSVGFTEEQQSKEGIEYNYRREKVFHWRPDQAGGGQTAENWSRRLSLPNGSHPTASASREPWGLSWSEAILPVHLLPSGTTAENGCTLIAPRFPTRRPGSARPRRVG